MFTGIITDIGTVAAIDGGRFTIDSAYEADSIALGASIACDGCCLTVIERAPRADGTGARFAVDVSNETLSKTTLGSWSAGSRINLERAMRAGDEFGGHIVSGHVDGLATVQDVYEDGASRRFVFRAPDALQAFIAPKGSVALGGTSLTVNDVDGATFGVNLIPHTLTVTTWGATKPGDAVNLEIDMLARYVQRAVDVLRPSL
ncbi:MAG: riboflavin synthase [Pseudomonadota bacterium]